MGCSDFIVVPKLKIVLRVSSRLDKEDVKYIDKFLNQCEDFDDEISDKKYRDLTLKDLSKLINLTDSTWVFKEIYTDIFLVYWLDKNEIEYEIKHENDIDEESMKEKGYKFLE